MELGRLEQAGSGYFLSHVGYVVFYLVFALLGDGGRMKRGKAPNARQKRWHGAVAQLPCASCGVTPVHIHHCVGSTTKHNKVWIGQDWVIPLCYDCHQGPGGVHGDMSRVRTSIGHDSISRKAFEKLLFDETVIAITEWCGLTLDPEILPPADAHEAIMDYHK